MGFYVSSGKGQWNEQDAPGEALLMRDCSSQKSSPQKREGFMRRELGSLTVGSFSERRLVSDRVGARAAKSASLVGTTLPFTKHAVKYRAACSKAGETSFSMHERPQRRAQERIDTKRRKRDALATRSPGGSISARISTNGGCYHWVSSLPRR